MSKFVNSPLGTARKFSPIALFGLGLIIVIYGLKPPHYAGEYDVASFAELPVQTGGRVMPLDSVAMNTLRIISQRSVIKTENGKLPAIEWLMQVAFAPEKADTIPVFRIDNAEVLGMLGIRQEKTKYFPYTALLNHRSTIGEQANRVNPEPQLRSAYENQLVKLAIAMNQYERLKISFHAGGGDISQLRLIYDRWLEVIKPGRIAFTKREKGEPYDEQAYRRFEIFISQFIDLSTIVNLGIVPPMDDQAREIDDWANVGEALLSSIITDKIDPVVNGYLNLAIAYQNDDAATFNKILAKLHIDFDGQAPTGRVAFEEFFNTFAPFYQASTLYVLIFIIVAFSWLAWPQELQRSAFWLLVLAFVIHTFGLVARMYIQGRPPVTNLYSSAIFIGWGAVLLGIILERIFKGGVGAFTASVIGFITLVIAYNLAKTGDTLEMMQAVLDSNFWLATHVVIITIGYSSVFLAGALAVYYLAKRILGGIDDQTKRSLYRMVYGITCFSLLFSFVGTMLGGIWADQSWGRFWGWDPKENGALIIVLWCALMLHARWGGLVRERGFMVLAIGGNIATAWSWFGTNLLGVGLHSYGFSDSGFMWLAVFCFTQLALMCLACAPGAKKVG